MLNYIWLGLILAAVLMGGATGHLQAVTDGAFDSAKTGVMTLALPLVGIMALWLGIMRLAEKSGLVQVLARALRPALRLLFPEIPAEHPAMGAMVMNIAANMLGLGNAATPLGLRAMQRLERLNPHPGTATNAMCTFLAINTSSVQLIPATAVGHPRGQRIDQSHGDHRHVAGGDELRGARGHHRGEDARAAPRLCGPGGCGEPGGP